MNIVITGADGFIAKNLYVELKNRGYKYIFLVNRNTTQEQLEEYLDVCDVIIHLAGKNRPNDIREFDIVNVGFTETIVSYLKKRQRTPKIIFSSSIQAELNNAYGISKRKAEEVLLNFAKETSADIRIYRLPNVFGKWCKPNYNSVVATFCYNIANNNEICIHDKNAKVKLVYIDDVVESIIEQIKNNIVENPYIAILPIYEVKVREIAELLYSFRESRRSLTIPNLLDDFEKKLYSTYLSYLNVREFCYPLKMNEDERGAFTEFIRTESKGQISINIAKPGVTKGNHWHHTKVEKFLVVRGEALIQFRHMVTNEVVEYFVSGNKLEVVDIPVGYTHNIKNIGKDDLVTVMWANETFNLEKPDTFFEVV